MCKNEKKTLLKMEKNTTYLKSKSIIKENIKQSNFDNHGKQHRLLKFFAISFKIWG